MKSYAWQWRRGREGELSSSMSFSLSSKTNNDRSEIENISDDGSSPDSNDSNEQQLTLFDFLIFCFVQPTNFNWISIYSNNYRMKLAHAVDWINWMDVQMQRCVKVVYCGALPVQSISLMAWRCSIGRPWRMFHLCNLHDWHLLILCFAKKNASNDPCPGESSFCFHSVAIVLRNHRPCDSSATDTNMKFHSERPQWDNMFEMHGRLWLDHKW